jgi:hypothetical protein
MPYPQIWAFYYKFSSYNNVFGSHLGICRYTILTMRDVEYIIEMDYIWNLLSSRGPFYADLEPHI